MNDISKAYGSGLFQLASENGTVKETLDETRALGKLFERSYLRILADPSYSKEERIGMVSAALDGKVSREVANFVKLMTERNLALEIPSCFKEYENLYYETEGIIRVTAESAVELSGDQKTRLEEKLSKNLGRPVEVTYRLNHSLVGGMRLLFEGKRIDETIKKKLRDISTRLSRTVI